MEQAWWDICLVLGGGGWNPSELDRMSLAELSRWHDKAMKTAEAREEAAAKHGG